MNYTKLMDGIEKVVNAISLNPHEDKITFNIGTPLLDGRSIYIFYELHYLFKIKENEYETTDVTSTLNQKVNDYLEKQAKINELKKQLEALQS